MNLELTPAQVSQVIDEYLRTASSKTLENLIVRCFRRNTGANDGIDLDNTLRRVTKIMIDDYCLDKHDVITMVKR